MRSVLSAPVSWTPNLRTRMGPGVLMEMVLPPLTYLGAASLAQ